MNGKHQIPYSANGSWDKNPSNTPLCDFMALCHKQFVLTNQVWMYYNITAKVSGVT